jgi:UDP-N-acetylglucosamine--N-acetylmuramyl-(pentapeptide) pyrophosphoryl-undecaprenol N-acetylglucosamine transferase
MRILIAAGGTGGHVYPALAVARSLRERLSDVEFRWLGGHRGLERELVPLAGHRLDRLWLRSLRTVNVSPATVTDPLRLVASFPQALAIVARWRPQVLFTTGGYLAMPVLAAAAALRVPSVVWEGNLVPGRSVRATARLATAIAASFEETCNLLPGRCFVTGTPIREFGMPDTAAARRRLGIGPGAPCLLVFGGSQAVRRLNHAVRDALPRLVERASVVHLTGQSSYATALAWRAALPAELRDRYQPHPFLRDEMTDALIAADLVVGRAGSSTLAEATALGLPLVVVPYPHASAHQAANAQRLALAGAARIVADDEFDARALLEAAALLADSPQLERMRLAARAFARPGAAAAVSELVMRLASRQPLPAGDEIDRLSRAAA